MKAVLGLFLVACAMVISSDALAQCTAPKFPREHSRIVVDDGNNLRKWGGKEYASAPILKVLKTGDEVRLIAQDAKWAEVETEEGMKGFVNAKCLAPYELFVTGKSAAGNYEALLGCGEKEKVATFLVDLDGDGKKETIRLTCESGVGCSNSFMDVLSASGQVLFKGPRHGNSPFIFCRCDAGEYQIKAAGDLDGDGKGEILTVVGPSDVSPAGFLLFRWTGAGFDEVWSESALVSSKESPDAFILSKRVFNSPEPYRYLVGVETNGEGVMVAHVAGADGGSGEAVVTLQQKAMKVVRWAKPYKK